MRASVCSMLQSAAPTSCPLPARPFRRLRRLYSPCPKGTFSNKEGDVQCSPCPVNTYSFGGGTAARPTAVRACIKW